MKDFYGRGFGFPFEINAFGNVRMTGEEQAVLESIHTILGTAVGERVMRPKFGCRIHDLVFHPNGPNTWSQVSMHVKEALKKWEPRVDEINVRSVRDPHAENVIQINIEFRLRRTNAIKNLVYPFYLRREQDL